MEDARRNSSLPSGVFKSENKVVEQDVFDGPAHLLLKQLGGVTRPTTDDTEEAPKNARGDRVSPDDIEAFLAAHSNLDEPPAPDLLAGQRDEHLWVLAELARPSTGRSCQVATRRLRELFDDPAYLEALDRGALQALCDSASAGDTSALMALLGQKAENELANRTR